MKTNMETQWISTDFEMAETFLSLFAPLEWEFHFRTLPDDKERTRFCYPKSIKGTFREYRQELKDQNFSGSGVFVVVNDGGHKDAEINRIRAVFADTDGAPVEPIVSALDPHLVVESSPGKYHVYWLVDDAFDVAMFRPIQSSIAQRFGTDAAVCNPSRVMRLPGFLHNKKTAEPFLTRIEAANPELPRYGHDELVEGLGLEFEVKPVDRTIAQSAPLSTEVNSNGYSLAEVQTALERMYPFCKYKRWSTVGFILADAFGEDARDLFLRWSRGELWKGELE